MIAERPAGRLYRIESIFDSSEPVSAARIDYWFENERRFPLGRALLFAD